MNHFKSFLKHFRGSFILVCVPILIVIDFIRENEPTFWDYFFTVVLCFLFILNLIIEIKEYQNTLKKLKKD
tara:strand:+ start:70 stop:282 length:213 start_codon:yes stop_codon:yes gene_type:complete